MLWCVTVRLKRKPLMTLLPLLVFFVIAASILDSAMGAPNKLLVQNVDISPRVAKIGESVRIKANMRNVGRSTIKCDAKAFVGESVVEEFKGIIIPPGETFSLMFVVSNSSLKEGTNPVDMIVEEGSSEQSIYDLGSIQVQQDVQQGGIESGIFAGFNILYLLAIFPLGGAVAFFVWKRRSKKNQEDN